MRKAKRPIPDCVRVLIPPRPAVAPYARRYWLEVQTRAAIDQPRSDADWARLGEICNDYIETRIKMAALLEKFDAGFREKLDARCAALAVRASNDVCALDLQVEAQARALSGSPRPTHKRAD